MMHLTHELHRVVRLALRVVPAAVWVAVSLAPSTVAAQGLTGTASAENGKAAFIKNGCWQCHGFVGQGGAAGPKLAPNPLPLAALNAFIRNTTGRMPPYQEAVLSNADLADIHAYLQSLPQPADVKSIQLLQ